MNTYNCQFFGRLIDNNGPTCYNVVRLEADTVNEAYEKLLDSYQNITKYIIKNTNNPEDNKCTFI